MKRISILSILLLFVFFNYANAQIFSTAEGGHWSDTLTWIGHKVPNKNNDVVIYGTVTGTGQCYNLVNEWEIKKANIEVFGDLINRGGIINRDEDDQSGIYTTLTVHGDITNKELIKIGELYLAGQDGHTHYIESTDTAVFVATSFMNAENNRCHLLLKDDLMIQNTMLDFGEDSKIELEGYNIRMFGSHLWYSMIEGDGDNYVEFNLGSRLAHQSKLKDVVLKGRINTGTGFNYSSKFLGTVSNEGVLQDSLYGASTRIIVEGTLINKGTIQDNALRAIQDYRTLIIEAMYDLYNHGTWKNGNVKLIGDDDQNLYFYNDVEIESFSITDTVGKVIAQTNLTFHDTYINGNYASIMMNGNKLYNDGEDNQLYRVNLNNAVLDGNIQLLSGNKFLGSTVNNGVLSVFGSNPNTIDIYDEFTNNGTITKSIKNGLLTTNIYGNITNNGTWENSNINFWGSEDQTIFTSKPITAKNVYDRDLNSKLIAGSDLLFQNSRLTLNKSTLVVDNGYSLSFKGTDPNNKVQLSNGVVEMNGNDLIMNGNSYLQSYVEINQPNIVGTVAVGSSVTLSGDINVTDTLTTREKTSSTLDVNGNITNHGVIANRDDLSSLSIELTGDLINLGDVAVRKIDLIGEEADQNIMLMNNKSISNQVRFYDNTDGTTRKWMKDGEVIAGQTYQTLRFDSLTVNDFGTYQCSTNVGFSRNINVMSDSLSVDFIADTTFAVIGDSIKFQSIIFGVADEVEWDFGDGINSAELSPVHQYTQEGKYTVSLVVKNLLNEKSITKVDYIEVAISVDVNDELGLPDSYQLEQNYPNPFNPTTSISYSVPEYTSSLTIKVYDLLGRVVAEVVNKAHQPGNYKVDFNASGLASGMYIYRMESDNFVNTKKMILLR